MASLENALEAPLYPPSPLQVPVDLTRPSTRYKVRVVLLLVNLFLFLLLYLALLAAAVWFTYWSATYEFGSARGGYNPLLNIGLPLAGGMLFLFLLKGLFKQRRADRNRYIEINESEQSELFSFIYRLCEEVKTDRPAKVYVSSEVNAAVFYDTSLKALFIPPPRHLLIGLGLVNSVTLSEFKATLAHEFGHFSQRSMRLGIYVYMANHILHDIIYARDTWDVWLVRWCRLDPRLSFPAWGLRALIWMLRKSLGSVFRLLNRVNLSLSRQMEFNADDVAVSVSGSDPITHVLCRLKFASDALEAASEDLFVAADHGLFTTDLFFHQSAAGERIRRIHHDPNLGKPPAIGSPEPIFSSVEEEDNVTLMWMTHPSNQSRESNAKRNYLHVPLDDRSPWLLFSEARKLRKAMTAKFYLHELRREGKLDEVPSEKVQTFIDQEHAEMTFDPKYHGLYDNRLIDLSAQEESPLAAPLTRDQITDYLAHWPPENLSEQMVSYRLLQAAHQTLMNLQASNPPRSFSFRELSYSTRDLPMLLIKLERELLMETEKLEQLDRKIFQVHGQAAKALDMATELEERYRFHSAIQKLLRTLLEGEAKVSNLLKYLDQQTEQEASVFKKIVEAFNDVSKALEECLRKSTTLKAPPLSNVPQGTPLRELLGGDSLQVPHLAPDTNQIPADWTMSFIKVQAGVLGRLRRVHFKSLGNILRLQEKIAARWKEKALSYVPKE